MLQAIDRRQFQQNKHLAAQSRKLSHQIRSGAKIMVCRILVGIISTVVLVYNFSTFCDFVEEQTRKKAHPLFICLERSASSIICNRKETSPVINTDRQMCHILRSITSLSIYWPFVLFHPFRKKVCSFE